MILWSEEGGFVVQSDRFESNRYKLTFAKSAAFSISFDRREIGIIPETDHISRDTLEHLLADQVLPRILAHEGRLVLHAGAVDTASGAIVVVGLSGSGKSTLAASLHQAGYPLLGDDAVILADGPEVPHCSAVYRSLRLYEDSIHSIFTVPVRLEKVAHYSSKRYVRDLDEHGYAPSPVPVRGMVFLAPEPSKTIEARRMSAAEACMAMIEHSFWIDPTDVGQARGRFLQASAVASHFPAFELSYPRDFKVLDDVRAVILGLLDGATARPQPGA